jgi:arylsulfatase A-like enzyme
MKHVVFGIIFLSVLSAEAAKPALHDPELAVNNATLCENYYTAMGWGSSAEAKRMKKEIGNFPSRAVITGKFKYVRYDDVTPVIEQPFDPEKDPGRKMIFSDKSECRYVLEKPGSRLDQFNTENEPHRNKYTPAAILGN